MLWSEVRELFPNQFVLVEELKSHYVDNQLHVEEVAVMKALDSPPVRLEGIVFRQKRSHCLSYIEKRNNR